jgi:hypothetical protein
MKYKVIVDTLPQDAPQPHEMSAAFIVANHFATDVVFQRPGNRKTPDFDVNGVKWELKSPIGDGKKTMENNLRGARKQSNCIIIDLRRCKMHQMKALSRINFYLKNDPKSISKLKIIKKTKEIVDII